jgi:DNA-binding FadR family transcriptional regulator
MREIASGDLQPGDHFASEQELMTRLHVSRSSLREALRLLESFGVIASRRGTGGGIRVTWPRAQQIASSLAMALEWRDATLRTVLEARGVIDPTLAALAARRRSEEHVKELEDCIRIMRDQIDDPAAFDNANRHFHDVVADASGNELMAILSPSLTWMSATVGWTHPPPVRPRLIAANQFICDAIREHDSWLASQRMSQLLALIENVTPEQSAILRKPIIWADVDEMLEP